MPRLPVLALALLSLGCDDGHALVIDLRTDFVASREFASVRTELRDGSGEVVASEEHLVGVGERYGAGVQVADFDGLAAGTYAVGVRLTHPDGRFVGRAETIVNLTGDQVAAVWVRRSCPAGDCVPCEMASDCAVAPACVARSCGDGFCVFVPDDDACGAGLLCDARAGCQAEPGDAGVCMATAPADGCGLGDEDCDALVDEDCGCVEDAWALAPVDAEEGMEVGRGVDLAVTPAGALHAVYYARDALRYATHPTGNVWTSLDVPDLDSVDDHPIALDVDSAQTLHVVFRSGRLRYAQRLRDGSWSQQPIDEEVDLRRPSLRVDEAGAVHLVARVSDRELYYAARPPLGAFSAPELIATDVDLGEDNPVAIGPTGTVYIAFRDRAARSVRLARREPGGEWTFETIETGDRIGDHIALAIDGSGTIHLAHVSEDGSSGVHYARIGVGTPAPELTVFGEATQARDGVALAAGGADEVHVVFLDRNTDTLQVASAAEGFTPRPIAPVQSGDLAFAGAVDPDGRLHVVFRDGRRDDLRHAVRTPDGALFVEPLRVTGDQGRQATIACGTDGTCHVVARSSEGSRFGYSRGRGDSFWRIERVDAANGGDQEPSVRVGPDGAIHLAYRAADQSLAHASRPPGGEWAIEGPAGTAPANDPELFVTPDGSLVAIAFAAGDELRWAERTATGWDVSTIEAGIDARWPDGVATETGRVHLAWFADGLRYAVREPGTASFGPVDVIVADSNAGEHASLELVGGSPVVAYHRSGQDDLLLAERATGAWAIEPLQTDDHVGRFASLLVAPDGAIEIAYYDDTVVRDASGFVVARHEDLLFGRRAPGGAFERAVVDAEGNAGSHASAGADDRGRVFVAYHQANDRQVRLARRCR